MLEYKLRGLSTWYQLNCGFLVISSSLCNNSTANIQIISILLAISFTKILEMLGSQKILAIITLSFWSDNNNVVANCKSGFITFFGF